jgi:uncharacterized Zn-binding protein involved in type VI secretion
MHRVHVLLVLAICAAATAASAADDPFNGTWQLNTAKSKYTPGPAPDKATVTIQSDGTTMTVKGDSSYEGKPLVTTYTVKLDGTPAAVQGSPVIDMVSVRKVDDRTRQFTNMKDGKTVGESRATVSADGKTATVTGSGVNPKGVRVEFTAVYDKQ